MNFKRTNIEIETYNIRTCMGKVAPMFVNTKPLPFITDEELDELNTIGYTGKNKKGIRTTREVFLNTLGKGRFRVEQTKFDNGDFTEKFTITRAYLK